MGIARCHPSITHRKDCCKHPARHVAQERIALEHGRYPGGILVIELYACAAGIIRDSHSFISRSRVDFFIRHSFPGSTAVSTLRAMSRRSGLRLSTAVMPAVF